MAAFLPTSVIKLVGQPNAAVKASPSDGEFEVVAVARTSESKMPAD